MGWNFRKSKKVGPFRINLSKSGISGSVGAGGFRVGASPRGKTYSSFSAMGFNWREPLGGSGGGGAASFVRGCGCLALVVAGGMVMAFGLGLVLIAGLGGEKQDPVPTARPQMLASDTTEKEQDSVESVSSSPTIPPEVPIAEPSFSPLSTEEIASLIGPLATNPPPLPSEPRKWVDVTGKHETTAALEKVEGDLVTLHSVDRGTYATLSIDKLSEESKRQLRVLTEPRVNVDREVLIGEVVSILDGDTVHVKTGPSSVVTVRLDGIDAPEKGQAFSNVAEDRLGELVFKKVVRVEATSKDRYQRTLGTLYVGNKDASRILVREGLAWHYKKYSKDEALANLELVAKHEKVGLWSEESPIAPWDWRDGVRPVEKIEPSVAPPVAATTPQAEEEPSGGETIVYITENGSKYHRAGCRHLRKSSIPIPLSRAKSAYSPCDTCH